MVIRPHPPSAARSSPSQRGALTTELIVAMAIFVIALLPMAHLLLREHRIARLQFNRAVAGEILDGELEILLAGEWKTLQPGTQELVVHAQAVRSLPPGRFEVSFAHPRLQLTWTADKPRLGGHASRGATLSIP